MEREYYEKTWNMLWKHNHPDEQDDEPCDEQAKQKEYQES
jgi:hypothetical protein